MRTDDTRILPALPGEVEETTPDSPAKNSADEAAGPEKKKKKLELSVTQVVGGALAAMTAAALGSQLSVAGTVVGAAVASIVATVAGALYTASLRHTRDRVRTVWTGRADGSGVPVSVEVVASPAATTGAGTAAGRAKPAVRRRGPDWRGVTIGAVVAFGLAALGLTGIELATGHALSGGKGTTISQVTKPSGTSNAKPKPTASPSVSATPSASASGPAGEPSAAPSTQPTASSAPSATAPASAPPSQVPSGTASEPTPAATAPTAAASGGPN